MNKFLFSITFIFIFTLSNAGFASALMNDYFVDTTLKTQTLEKPQPHMKYNYLDTTQIPVKLSITRDILSEGDVYEGQTIQFRVKSNVIYKGQVVIKKDTIVPAKVETIIVSGMNGIPASVIVGSFKFENIPSGQITNTYEFFGQDRSLWVFPLKWALTPLPPTGSLTNFIKGGHAKLDRDDTITIYYYPNWI